MPFLKETTINGGLLLLWEMSETTEEILLLAKKFTSKPAFEKITLPKRQREWLAVRLLLDHAGCTADISYDENGKPCLEHSEFQSISISHSNKIAGVYLHPSPQAGLDIEATNRNYNKIAGKYLAPDEYQLATATNNGYALFWCIKEAAYKAAGIPGLIFNEQIKISQPTTPDSFKVDVISDQLISFPVDYLQIDDQILVCLSL